MRPPGGSEGSPHLDTCSRASKSRSRLEKGSYLSKGQWQGLGELNHHSGQSLMLLPRLTSHDSLRWCEVAPSGQDVHVPEASETKVRHIQLCLPQNLPGWRAGAGPSMFWGGEYSPHGTSPQCPSGLGRHPLVTGIWLSQRSKTLPMAAGNKERLRLTCLGTTRTDNGQGRFLFLSGVGAGRVCDSSL